MADEGADAGRILLLPLGVGVALLGIWAGVGLQPAEERVVMVLLGLCCACLVLGATLVGLRSRRLEVALADARGGASGVDRSCPVGLFRVDADGLSTWVSDGWCQLTGRAREDAVGARWEEVLHPSERVLAKTAFRQAAQAGRTVPIDHRVVRPDGAVVQVVGQLSFEGARGYVGVLTTIGADPRASRLAA